MSATEFNHEMARLAAMDMSTRIMDFAGRIGSGQFNSAEDMLGALYDVVASERNAVLAECIALMSTIKQHADSPPGGDSPPHDQRQAISVLSVEVIAEFERRMIFDIGHVH